ncbi:MAG: amidohydrolase family protein [Firmicutes bacterium]|nr:amidohydrolase family protein [Bacillota bacterium]
MNIFHRVQIFGRDGLFSLQEDQGQIRQIVPWTKDTYGWERADPLPTQPFRPGKSSAIWDAAGRLMLPGLVDIHTHLDKAQTLPFAHNFEGTLLGAINAFRRYRKQMTVQDVFHRALSTAQDALSYGTTTLRTHIDAGDPIEIQLPIVLEGLAQVKHTLKDRMDIQVVVMCPAELSCQDFKTLASCCPGQIDAMGGAPHLSSQPQKNIENILALATMRHIPVDVHIDETLDPHVRTLEMLAESVRTTEFSRPVVAGHCVSLGAMPWTDARPIIDKVAAADIHVVTLPATNLYLQGREDHAGVRRGVTRVKELQQAGVLVAAASDNIQDAFHPFGQGDVLNAALLTAYTAHFGEEDAGRLLKMVSTIPGRMAIHPHYGIHVGEDADWVILDAKSPLEVLQKMPTQRWVFKKGRLVSMRLVQKWQSDETLNSSI